MFLLAQVVEEGVLEPREQELKLEEPLIYPLEVEAVRVEELGVRFHFFETHYPLDVDL